MTDRLLHLVSVSIMRALQRLILDSLPVGVQLSCSARNGNGRTRTHNNSIHTYTRTLARHQQPQATDTLGVAAVATPHHTPKKDTPLPTNHSWELQLR